MVKRKKTSAPKSSGSELNELMIQAVRTGVALAEKGLGWAERESRNRRLHKTYPYLNQALSNVKNVLDFLKLGISDNQKAKTHERKKRKTHHKKVSK